MRKLKEKILVGIFCFCIAASPTAILAFVICLYIKINGGQ